MIPTIFAPELAPGDAALQLPVHPALLLPEVFSSTKIIIIILKKKSLLPHFFGKAFIA